MKEMVARTMIKVYGIIILLVCFSNAFGMIKIETKNTLLLLNGSAGEKLTLLYYGNRIENADDVLALSSQKPDDAYPALGTGLIQSALNVTHTDGNLSTILHFEKYEQKIKSENITETIVQLKDSFYPFWVELHYEAFFREDIIQTWVVIRHLEEGEVVLGEYCSSALSINNQARDYYLTYFQGTWGAEMSVIQEKLVVGQKLLETVGGIRSSFQHTPDFLGEGFNPSFMISFDHPAEENSGEVIGGSLAWTGAWKFNFRLSSGNRLSITTGINSTAGTRYLAKDEIFVTPAMLYSFSNSGKGQISRNFHLWARNYGIRDGNKQRDILLNSWEGVYFNPEEKTLVSMMDGVQEIGGEMFVVDDGWFGTKYPRKFDAEGGLGDWITDTRKIPNGLPFLVKEAGKRGLKFGIWVEPEMVNEESVLFETHPEWIIGSKHRDNRKVRNQHTLDLSNPDVRDYVFEAVDKIIRETPGLAYIKWDANRDFTDVGSNYLSAEHQSHVWKDYIDGLYAVLERVSKDHPGIVLQACSSGGGRVDYGILKYFHEFWTSDNTDALQRIFVQWGTSHFYPAMAMASHVTLVPNHQTGRTVPLKFRFDVAMSGRLGFEFQPKNLSQPEIEFARQAVNTYKDIREIVQQGDLYRLLSPYGSNFSSMMYTNEGKTRAVAFIYHFNKMSGEVPPRIKFLGLDENLRYRVTEINALPENIPVEEGGLYLADHLNLKENVLSGQALRNTGIQPLLYGEYDSVVILFESLKN